jgi:DNA-binding winged helix-turn-helix (wHTH) protein
VQILFGDHMLDDERRELRRGAETIAVEPQVFDLLIYLIRNRDRVVSKDDLIDAIWGGRAVSDSTLTSRINAARKALGDSGQDQKLIRTVARKADRRRAWRPLRGRGQRSQGRWPRAYNGAAE